MNTIDNFKSSLAEHGYVGDTGPAVLVYLTILSALQENPVSLLIKGTSGCGKSFALMSAKRYLPEDAYVEFNAMSEKSLAYLGEKVDLKHKSLIIQEASGMAQGQGRLFLRQLLTEGQIKYATVQTTRDGLEGIELPMLEGPCGLVMTTTANSLHQEDENRMISIQMSEDPSLIRAKLLAKARDQISLPSDEELEPFHAKYYEIKESGLAVTAPFAEQIIENLPLTHHRIVRDFEKILSLINTVALLHANEREGCFGSSCSNF